MTQRHCAAALPALAACTLAACTLAGAAHAQSFSGLSYNDAAAGRGQAAYSESCANCHGAGLADGAFGPPLKGAAFDGHWRGKDAAALLDFIQSRMPPAGPGSLGGPAYADIAAYLIKANGGAGGGTVLASGPAPGPREAPSRDERPAMPAMPQDARAKAILTARQARLNALTPVTDAMLEHPADADWLIWRRTYQVHGFSTLKQIDTANVSGLRQAWSWSLPISQNESTPLVHEGVLFVQSGAVVQALDGATGDLLWQYVRPLAPAMNGGRASRAKAMAIWGDKLYVPTADKHLIALNIHTGALVWDHEGVAGGQDFQMDGAPIVARGKIFLGVSLGLTSGKGGCYILAIDAETGKEVWRFSTVAQPGQPGGDSWNGHPPSERFGGGAWVSGSYDPERKLLFFGVGNTYDVGTLLSPNGPPKKGQTNDALYTDATLALDPDSGKLVWFYQHMNRDVWDMDWVFEQTLATLPVDGKPRDVVITAGKLAIFDAMDRATGQYLFSKDMGLQNLVTAIDPKTGHKTTNPALEPVSGAERLVCPATTGARSWPATAFNPATHILYVPMVESCMTYKWTARSAAETAAGGADFQYPNTRRPDSDGNYGRIMAVDLDRREILWTVRQRAPPAGAVLLTAGGLAFNGSVDRVFHAYDQATGKDLWQARLNASPSSSPVTYAIGGEQYVAVITGGAGAYDSDGVALVPEVRNPVGGNAVVVFKLPSAVGR